MKPRGVIKRGVVVALAPALTLAAFSVAVSLPFALLVAPTVMLFALLALGRAPGEHLIERLRRRFDDRARIRRAAWAAPRPSVPVLVHRTGRTFAAALAMRPPPAAA